MAKHVMKIRACVAQLPEDSYPAFVCAMDYLTWEIIAEEEWEEMKRQAKASGKGVDPRSADEYEYRDLTIELPGIDKKMFELPNVIGQIVEGPDA